ncbi:MAG: acetylglutamate kinase [Chitinophagales bacterium]
MQQLNILKIGGNIINNPSKLGAFLQKFAAIEGLKILVHGGGRSATDIAEKLGIETQMVGGRRITSAEMLEVVTMVFAGVNKGIVAKLQGMNCNALGLTGADLNLIQAVKRPVKTIDYGFVGDVIGVNSLQLNNLLKLNISPIVAPLTHDQNGQLLNTNADTVAASLAKAMADSYEVRLIYCFEKNGVLLDVEDDASFVPKLSVEDFEAYQADGIVKDGMVPKLTTGFEALKEGVAKVVICSAEGFDEGDLKGTELVLGKFKYKNQMQNN